MGLSPSVSARRAALPSCPRTGSLADPTFRERQLVVERISIRSLATRSASAAFCSRRVGQAKRCPTATGYVLFNFAVAAFLFVFVFFAPFVDAAPLC
jgi:hypothetical protein